MAVLLLVLEEEERSDPHDSGVLLQQQDSLIAFDASEFLFRFQGSCVLGDLMVLINSHTWKLV